MWLFSGMMFLIFIILGVTTALTPMFSRQATPFGVAIAGKHEEIEKKKKQFGRWSFLGSFLLGLPLFGFPFIDDVDVAEIRAAIYITIGIIIYLIFVALLYLTFRKQLINWKKDLPKVEQKKAQKIIIDLNYHEKLQTRSHLTFFIWQAVIIIIPIIIAFAFYDRIPAEIPINWNSQFEVNETISKSIWSILALPGLQVLMIPVFNYSNHAIVRSKQRLSTLDPKKASEKSRRFREAWSNFTFAMTLGTQLLISFLFLFSLFSQGRFTWMLIVAIVLFLVLALGGTLYLTLKYGQAGEKLLNEEERYYVDPDEESHWKLGIIYFNKEDPSVFVEKRFGIGATLNLARWQSWLLIIGLIVFVLLTIVWSYQLT
jgi:uncharacterized membrane protein